ncbi:hypothetical protein [Actinopolymorpha alba]|uniref:hypothetical protein n=1 Tax=Actinopolymorpha alba TaxID=533267 RepID=UPI0012F702D0|nr:hypothetical protein [Actinopolymorpha alba]
MKNAQGMVGRAVRRALVLGAATGLAMTAMVSAAGAATPDSWEKEDPMPMIEVLGIYAGIPLAMFGLITLLVFTPSLIRGSGSRPGGSWQAESEWFGARPASDSTGGEESTSGAKASLEAPSNPTQGGAGGQW